MKNKVLTGLSIFLGLSILFSVIFFIRSNRPMARAQEESIQVVKEMTDIREIDRFYWFTRKETSFAVLGRNQAGQAKLAIVPQTGGKVRVYDSSKGLTEYEAIQAVKKKYHPHKIIKVSLGLYEDQPTWEVVTKNENKTLNYYLLDFKTGDIGHVIKNI